jgi:hypothetical protein
MNNNDDETDISSLSDSVFSPVSSTRKRRAESIQVRNPRRRGGQGEPDKMRKRMLLMLMMFDMERKAEAARHWERIRTMDMMTMDMMTMNMMTMNMMMMNMMLILSNTRNFSNDDSSGSKRKKRR